MNTEVSEILEEIAPPSDKVATLYDDAQVYGSFSLGSYELALPAKRLRDVVHPPESFTPQPLAPDYVMGIMTLRDMTVPVLDLRTMLQVSEPRPNAEDMRIAIVEYGAYNVGMLFDDTAEVFRAEGLDDQFTDYSAVSEAGIVHGAFRLEDGARMIQLLDPCAIIEFGGAPLLRDIDAQARGHEREPIRRGPRFQSICFGLQNTTLGIDIHSVREIVKLGDVDKSLASGSIFPGTMQLRGETMALIDLTSVLGLAEDDQNDDDEEKHVIVVDDTEQLCGLVVDEISDIHKYFADEITSFPIFAEQMPEVFLGSVGDGDNGEILQIDIAKLLELGEIRHAVGRCGDSISCGADAGAGAAAARKRETFLTFRIDKAYGVQILDVVEVVDFPQEMLRPPLLNDCVEGILDLRGELIRVYSARRLYGISDQDVRSQQIIIFDRNDDRFGLAIDKVESIATVPTHSGRNLPDTNHNRTLAINEDVTEAICYEAKECGTLRDILALDPDAIARRVRLIDRTGLQPDEPTVLQAVE